MAHVTNVNRPSIDDLDDNIIKTGHILDHVGHVDHVVGVADLGGPGGDHQVVLLDRLLDIHQRQSVVLQLLRVEIDVNTPQLATKHRRSNHARRTRKHVADVVVRQVVAFFFIQHITGRGQQRRR